MKPIYKVVEHPTEWDITIYKTGGRWTRMAKVYVIRKPNDLNYEYKSSYKIVHTGGIYKPAIRLPKRFENLIRAWVQLRGET